MPPLTLTIIMYFLSKDHRSFYSSESRIVLWNPSFKRVNWDSPVRHPKRVLEWVFWSDLESQWVNLDQSLWSELCIRQFSVKGKGWGHSFRELIVGLRDNKGWFGKLDKCMPSMKYIGKGREWKERGWAQGNCFFFTKVLVIKNRTKEGPSGGSKGSIRRQGKKGIQRESEGRGKGKEGTRPLKRLLRFRSKGTFSKAFPKSFEWILLENDRVSGGD